jgi:hypothetical protein
LTWERAPEALKETIYFSDMIAAGYPVEKDDLSIEQWEMLAEFEAMKERLKKNELKELLQCLLPMKL